MPNKRKPKNAIEVLEEYGKLRADPKLVLSEADLANENDRAVIIILVTKIDDHLKDRIIDGMTGRLNQEDTRKLFDLDRANFEKKIQIAHVLGLIDAKNRDKLDLLRRIRNVCAHTHKPILFESQEVGDVCREVVADLMPQLAGQLRKAFIVECGMISLHARLGKNFPTYEDKRRRWRNLCGEDLP